MKKFIGFMAAATVMMTSATLATEVHSVAVTMPPEAPVVSSDIKYEGASVRKSTGVMTNATTVKVKSAVPSKTKSGEYDLILSNGTTLKPGDKNYATYYKSFFGREYKASSSSTSTSTTSTSTSTSTTVKVKSATYDKTNKYYVLTLSNGTKLKPGDKNYATYYKSYFGKAYVATTSTTNTGSTSSTTSTQASGTTKNMLPVLKDVNGKAVSSTVQQVSYSYLSTSQKYIYNQILESVKQNKTTATFDKSYTSNDIISAFWAVRSDYPYRGLNACSTSAGKSTYWTYYSESSDPEYALAMLDAYTKPMLDKAAKMSSDVEKVKYVHDWLIYTTNKKEKNWSAYNVIVGKKGMCEGYAHAFVYCMQKLGIQSMVVGGTTWSGENHAWNLVKVGGDWYECDVFWDDIITKAETDYTYTCFMQTTASLKAYDTYNGKSRTRYAYCSYAPIAKGTKYSPSNYKYSNGSNFSGLAKVVEPKK